MKILKVNQMPEEHEDKDEINKFFQLISLIICQTHSYQKGEEDQPTLQLQII